MSYQPQRSSRRNSGRGRRKVHHEKAKRKRPKHRSGGRYLLEERATLTSEEIVERTFGRVSSLGGQVFAFSPFSQYFDDWLLSLKSVLSEFESNPSIKVDEKFVKDRSQVIVDVERKLAERQCDEAGLQKVSRRLAKQNNLLVQTDTEYAHATQKLASKRNGEIKSLTRRINDFEEELDETSRMKTGINPFARRARSQKTDELTRKLDATKSELESVVKAFEVEQEKLHDKYEKRKQSIMEQARSLEKKVVGLETDGSVEDRRVACEELVNAVKALLQRKPPAPIA